MTMTTLGATPLQSAAKLVAVRLHARRGSGGVPSEARLQTLVDLARRERQREEQAAALMSFVEAARRAIGEVPARVQDGLDGVAAIAVDLGLAIARELVGAALDQGKVDPTPAVVRCLRECVHGSERADLTLRLHPDDLALVQRRLADMPELHEQQEQARFVADPALARGAVRAETSAGRLRYDPREVLERICDQVRREASQ